MIEVWFSRKFLVQVYKENEQIRISVCRNEVKNDLSWNDNISWEELQEIKNEIGYAGQDCIEVYPRTRDIVNVANMRHLWIMPEGSLDFIWRKKTILDK